MAASDIIDLSHGGSQTNSSFASFTSLIAFTLSSTSLGKLSATGQLGVVKVIFISTNSISETFYLSKGSTFSKNEISCDLNGEHSSAFVNGVFSLDQNKHHEIKANINHLVENTKSYQLVKSVLRNTSRSVYQGKIYVDSKAQKTDGYQLSKAILVDETTEFNAKPELEIYADDVKCSHGSASGSLDENSIFYLMSRGLNYKEARELLINGFLVEVINQITDEQIKKLIKNLYGLKDGY